MPLWRSLVRLDTPQSHFDIAGWYAARFKHSEVALLYYLRNHHSAQQSSIRMFKRLITYIHQTVHTSPANVEQ